jgi:hypothetical protein
MWQVLVGLSADDLFLLLICNLFYDTFSDWEYIALHERVIRNDELGRI